MQQFFMEDFFIKESKNIIMTKINQTSANQVFTLFKAGFKQTKIIETMKSQFDVCLSKSQVSRALKALKNEKTYGNDRPRSRKSYVSNTPELLKKVKRRIQRLNPLLQRDLAAKLDVSLSTVNKMIHDYFQIIVERNGSHNEHCKDIHSRKTSVFSDIKKSCAL